jgi:hypothetical protein
MIVGRTITAAALVVQGNEQTAIAQLKYCGSSSHSSRILNPHFEAVPIRESNGPDLRRCRILPCDS